MDDIKLRKAIKDILHEHVLDFEDCPEGIDGHFGKCKNYVTDKIIDILINKQ